jgi:hypothetical protein
MALSARQVEQYQDDGFVCPVPDCGSPNGKS